MRVTTILVCILDIITMFPIITLPELATWGQQLASVVPLAALLEFIDLQQKLHVFELT